MTHRMEGSIQANGLADIVERVLDKGLVIAGDVAVNLVGVELLTIKLRLVLCSVDKARELGIGWWRHDPFLTGLEQPQAGGQPALTDAAAEPLPLVSPEQGARDAALDERLALLEAKLDRLLAAPQIPAPQAPVSHNPEQPRS